MKRSKGIAVQKRGFVLFMAASMLGAGFSLNPSPILAKEDLPSREINIVYDDSGSMYEEAGQSADTWSKAKYSMEVFASMLGEDDDMNIYYMSDYSPKGSKDGPKIELSGSDDAQDNVDEIHDKRTYSEFTAFETVEAAYDDLETSDADEKWLVILTDGDFQINGQPVDDKAQVTKMMDDFFNAKDPDVNVVFLAIGNEVVPVTEDKEKNVYFERAETSGQILDKVTEITNRIFNTNQLEASSKNGTFEFDIPMKQLTIFAQGEGAEVTGLTNDKDQDAGKMEPAVKVSAAKSSDNDRPEYAQSQPDSSLYGEIATFEGEFQPGKYTAEIKNAKNVKVYYQPDLAVSAWLTDSEGNTITDHSDIPTGDYTLHFGLVSGIDGSPLPEKNMLTKSDEGISYEATIKNNGRELPRIYGDGDTIHVEQGDLQIDATATYLKYNTSTTPLNFGVWKEKEVTFTPEEEVDWTLTSKKLSDKEPARILMQVEGQTPSTEEWEAVEVPGVSVQADGLQLENPVLIKGDEPGIFLLQPNTEQNTFTQAPYEKAEIRINMDQTIGSIPWVGESRIESTISDTRKPWEKDPDYWKTHWYIPFGLFVLAAALIALLIGYIPGVKKYLPKVEPKPQINEDPKNVGSGLERKTEAGAFEKDTKTKLLPYYAQTASIRYVPQSVRGARFPKMKVKATGDQGMEITNLKSFAGTTVKVNGKSLAEEAEKLKETKPSSTKNAGKGKKAKKPGMKLNRSSTISSENEDYTFRCQLNKKYKKQSKR